MHPTIEKVTRRIAVRSEQSRAIYLERIGLASAMGPARGHLSCSNLAHAIAASPVEEKSRLTASQSPNIAIVSAYNDMLSAHQPFENFPVLIKQVAQQHGASAQFAGGVPAMCDGVTQGQAGMDLSLFSRDVIAMSTAIALSHNMFDAALCLGICDKIVPGLLIGALSFGHLPVLFVPGGPMVSGLSNKEKAKVREEHAAGRASREELLAAESASYHSPGTCTFYGTANSNQMLMEIMGLQLPGSSFVNPNTPLREALTSEAVRIALANVKLGADYKPLAEIIDHKAIVNGIIGLLATGGSTNHTIHLVAIAAAAGIHIDWDDFAELSHIVPLLTRVYPNGTADVNHFHAAGGLPFLIGELLDAGLLHGDVQTILGSGLERFRVEPLLEGESIQWRPAIKKSLDLEVLRPVDQPFDAEGGLRLVQGNIGRAITKVSAVAEDRQAISAEAIVFHSQSEFADAFRKGELDKDFVAVLPFQGPRAMGMPELHKLTPFLSVLLNRGFQVALLTDGRMSGAFGKVLSAIQVTPEAANQGLIGCIRNGDRVRIDAAAGVLEVIASGQPLEQRERLDPDLSSSHWGVGRELFSSLREQVSGAEQGATIFPGVR